MIIYAKSPINKFRVAVGEVDIPTRTATFHINEDRFFMKADAFGIDENILKRKAVDWCDTYKFRFWDGRKLMLTKDEFLSKAWRYPPKNGSDDKAPAEVFTPKMVLTEEQARELLANRPKETEEQRLERLFREGKL